MDLKWDAIDRYLVISADTHGGADLWDYKAYLPKRWHDAFDQWASSYKSPYDDLVHATAHRNWDNAFRLSEMDADGIAAEIVFPNTIPPFFPTVQSIDIGMPKTRDDYERRWVGIQAHNRWMVDFCSQAPNRRKAFAQVLLNDVEDTVAEIKWAKETGCFGGVLMPAVPPGHLVEPLFHTRYEPIWALCEEFGMPIMHHVGTGVPEMPMDQPASHAVMVSETALWPKRSIGHLIFAGVFERYPELCFGVTETTIGWVQEFGESLDLQVRAMKNAGRTLEIFSGISEELSLLPSEYIRRNCYFGASACSPGEAEMRHVVGVDHLLWGSDYPHEEGTTPESTLALRWAFSDVAETDCRKILAGNAAALYGFDLDALVPVAQEIGPLVSEVHTPLPSGATQDASSGNLVVAGTLVRPFSGGELLERSRPADSSFVLGQR